MKSDATQDAANTSRRNALRGTAAAVAAVGLSVVSESSTAAVHLKHKATADSVTVKDGATIHYRDWGSGRPVVFAHGWPLSGDAWDSQMVYVCEHGFRGIAHDRRGHGKSSQPWSGNDMDTYADDLAAVINSLDLKEITLVGHSTGGGEIVRYMSRHGAARVKQVVMVSSVPPQMVKTDANPNGMPIDIFNGLRAAVTADHSQLYRDLSAPFFGTNRPGAKPLEGLREAFWLDGMRGSHKGLLDCIKQFSETDFNEDLKKINVPTLVVHGDDDQIVPFDVSSKKTAAIVKGAVLKVYPGAPHGLPLTHAEQFNADLLAFLKS